EDVSVDSETTKGDEVNMAINELKLNQFIAKFLDDFGATFHAAMVVIMSDFRPAAEAWGKACDSGSSRPARVGSPADRIDDVFGRPIVLLNDLPEQVEHLEAFVDQSLQLHRFDIDGS